MNGKYSRHGLAKYVRYGCRCDVCIADHADTLTMLDLYMDGRSTDQVASRYGITTDRVYQRMAMIEPEYAGKRRARVEAERAELAQAERRARIEANGPCRVCGGENDRHSRGPFLSRTCSTWCADMYKTVRYLVDEEFRERHQRLINLGHVENGGPVEVRSALRRLSGTSRTHGRWLIEGSSCWEWACRAYREAWPTFDRLPQQIQQQVADHFAAVAS